MPSRGATVERSTPSHTRVAPTLDPQTDPVRAQISETRLYVEQRAPRFHPSPSP